MINNKQGIDLKIFTIVPKTVLIIAFGFNPFLDVIYNNIRQYPTGSYRRLK